MLGGELAGLGMAQEYVCHGEKSLKIRVHIRAKNNAGRALSLSHRLIAMTINYVYNDSSGMFLVGTIASIPALGWQARDLC